MNLILKVEDQIQLVVNIMMKQILVNAFIILVTFIKKLSMMKEYGLVVKMTIILKDVFLEIITMLNGQILKLNYILFIKVQLIQPRIILQME